MSIRCNAHQYFYPTILNILIPLLSVADDECSEKFTPFANVSTFAQGCVRAYVFRENINSPVGRVVRIIFSLQINYNQLTT